MMSDEMINYRSHIRSIISLRPYGRNMLTKRADSWLWGAGSLAFMLSSIEASAWGFIVYENAESLSIASKILLSAGISLLVFLTVWICDSFVITMDLSGSLVSEKDEDIQNRLLDRLVKSIANGAIKNGVGIRLAFPTILVVGSMTITAPTIAQIFLLTEIDSEIYSRNSREVHKYINSEKIKFENRINEIEIRIAKKEEELPKELGGSGQSGIYGEGLVANEIRSQIKNLKNEIRIEKERFSKEENRITGLLNDRNISGLRNEYGLSLSEPNFASRELAAKRIKEENDYSRIEDLSVYMLGIIFSTFVGLKLFQPKAVKYYLCDELQSEYKKYLNGMYDSLLSRVEVKERVEDPYWFVRMIRELWGKKEDIPRRNAILLDSYKDEIEEIISKIDVIERDYSRLYKEKANLRINQEHQRSLSQEAILKREYFRKLAESEGADERWYGEEILNCRLDEYRCFEKLSTISDLTDQIDEKIVEHKSDLIKLGARRRELLKSINEIEDM